jgi:hypothetical protein
MGDSYSSGEGVPPFYADSNTGKDKCHRSRFGYPTMVRLPGQPLPIAQMGGDVRFSFIACSGSETTGITTNAVFGISAAERGYSAAGNTDWGKEQYRQEPLQATSSALTSQTTLVTLTVGGNDARFADVLTGCLLLPPKLKTHCSSPTYTLERRSNRARDPMPSVKFEPIVINLLEAHLVAVYQAIHAKAPHAEIIVSGYPLLFPVYTTVRCKVVRIPGKRFTLSAPDQNWLNEMGTLLNKTVAAAVAKVQATGVRIRFVDPTAAFVGHAICSSQPWINGLKLRVSLHPVNPASFHPNKAGQAEYAKLVNGCLDGTVPC